MVPSPIKMKKKFELNRSLISSKIDPGGGPGVRIVCEALEHNQNGGEKGKIYINPQRRKMQRTKKLWCYSPTSRIV